MKRMNTFISWDAEEWVLIEWYWIAQNANKLTMMRNVCRLFLLQLSSSGVSIEAYHQEIKLLMREIRAREK